MGFEELGTIDAELIGVKVEGLKVYLFAEDPIGTFRIITPLTELDLTFKVEWNCVILDNASLTVIHDNLTYQISVGSVYFEQKPRQVKIKIFKDPVLGSRMVHVKIFIESRRIESKGGQACSSKV